MNSQKITHCPVCKIPLWILSEHGIRRCPVDLPNYSRYHILLDFEKDKLNYLYIIIDDDKYEIYYQSNRTFISSSLSPRLDFAIQFSDLSDLDQIKNDIKMHLTFQ